VDIADVALMRLTSFPCSYKLTSLSFLKKSDKQATSNLMFLSSLQRANCIKQWIETSQA